MKNSGVIILAYATLLVAGLSPFSFAMDTPDSAASATTRVVHSTKPTWDEMVDESLSVVADSVSAVAEHLKGHDKKNDPLVFTEAAGEKVHVAYAARRPRSLGGDAVGIRFVVYMPTKYHVNKASSGFEPGKDIDLVAILILKTRYTYDETTSTAEIGIEELTLEGLWPTDREGRSRQATHIAELAAALEADRE